MILHGSAEHSGVVCKIRVLFVNNIIYLGGVKERDQRARHMKGECIEPEAHILLDRRYKENFIFNSFAYDLG